MKHVVISVTNDLVTDQRVEKVCKVLQSLHFEITLIGRKLPGSLPVSRNYKTIRMTLLFKKGFLFYAEYNIRLFFKLFFLKKDILLANDLDTLSANFLISKLFNTKLVYDSHELFTEVPELISRPKVQKIWLVIEKFIFPKLKNVYTVNSEIAKIYCDKYNVPVKVIRNIAPKLTHKKIDKALSEKIKETNKMLILQGSGINIDRGAEEAVMMMKHLENTILFIIGGGDIFEKIKKLVEKFNLKNKVFIKDKVSYNKLMEYTKIADLGLSLDKGTNLNYELSLPNKVFDYIQAQIPLLVSNRKIIADLVTKNNIGLVTQTHDPKELAKTVKTMLSNEDKLAAWKENLSKIAEIYTWEAESKKLIDIFNNLK